MQKGKLKYFSDLDCWKIVDEKNNKYDTNPLNADIYFRNHKYYRRGKVLHQTEKDYTKEIGWYVWFDNISFKLDKSRIYEILFNWESLF